MPLPLRATALAAALVVAATATASPATADAESPIWTVSTSAATSLQHRVDGTCHFRPDRMTADYPNVAVNAYATTTGAWLTNVRCELIWDGTDRGDRTWTQGGPVAYGEDGFSYVSDTGVQICVTASARFALADVDAPRYCTEV